MLLTPQSTEGVKSEEAFTRLHSPNAFTQFNYTHDWKRYCIFQFGRNNKIKILIENVISRRKTSASGDATGIGMGIK